MGQLQANVVRAISSGYAVVANTNGDGSYRMTTINLANWMAHRGYSS